MNEMEYIESRINDLEKSVKNNNLPMNIKEIQQTALLNYRSDLERLKNGLV